MKLLILTQKVDMNDDILGFFHGWLLEFAKNVEQLTVICLQKGEYDLPENVKVLSLGKEKGVGRIKYILNFYKYIFNERKNYDTVFVHMNPEYVILGGLIWKILNKKIGLWYVHKQVGMYLRITEKLVDIIFTATKESFSLASKKLHIVGHGIDTNKFVCKKKKQQNLFVVSHIGRITKIKNIDILIEAVNLLKNKIQNIRVELVGATITQKDKLYKQDLVSKIKGYGLSEIIFFVGTVPNREIPAFYRKADLTVNLTPTGGMDKVVLESAASGTPVISTNETFKEFFGDNTEQLLLKYDDPVNLAIKIEQIYKLPDDQLKRLQVFLQNRAKNYNMENLIQKIISKLQ